MVEPYNVFISWSGERSRCAAEALREWLGTLLQNAKPWMSDTDIEKGSRGLDEIARALEGMKVAIICLTPENLNAEWILYEAGALSKTLDAKTRVCTYLLAGLESKNLKPPLGLFQWTRADKTDTQKLIHTINKRLDVTPVQDNRLNNLFDKMWPELDAKLAALPAPLGALPPPRSNGEMIAEILELTRAMAPKIQDIRRETANARSIRQLGTPFQKIGSRPDVGGSIITSLDGGSSVITGAPTFAEYGSVIHADLQRRAIAST
jgi:TIR domain-containing protein